MKSPFDSSKSKHRTGETMAKENKQPKNKLGLLFAVLIPLLLAIVAVVVVLFLVDDEKLSNIPIISSLVPDEAAKQDQAALDKAKERITDQQDEIEDLNQEIDSLESIIDEQKQDIKKLEKKSEEKNEKTSGDDEEGLSEEEQEVKQVAGSFRKMDPEKAAGIVNNMDKQMAIDVIEQLSGDVRGGILAEMEAKKAAELTEGMLNN